jgi:hypothetical protein
LSINSNRLREDRRMSLFVDASPLKGFPVLDALPWGEDPAGALGHANELLEDEGDDLSHGLRKWLEQFRPDEIAYIGRRSSEKSTHQKWFLGEGGSAYSVWLHEYAPPDVFARSSRFAASIHNHRYSFTSRVLAGALHTVEYDEDPKAADRVVVTAKRSIEAGGTMRLSADTIHQIEAVAPRTRTLLIQGPIVRHYSTCYERGGGRRDIFDHESQFSVMLNELP